MDALAQLQLRGCADVKMSRILRTRPVGVDAGEEFLNAAAVLQTDLQAFELLQAMHEVEATFRRVRTRHWGPRTLDLDLILYGDHVIQSPQLVIPHPAMWYRRFVLEPAVEVSAEMVHPILNESVLRLFQRLDHRPLLLEVCCTGTPFFPIEILETAGIDTDAIAIQLVNPESLIGPDSLARINVRRDKFSRTSQPYNSKGREIEILCETKEEVLSKIEDLKIAMLG